MFGLEIANVSKNNLPLKLVEMMREVRKDNGRNLRMSVNVLRESVESVSRNSGDLETVPRCRGVQ